MSDTTNFKTFIDGMDLTRLSEPQSCAMCTSCTSFAQIPEVDCIKF